MRNAVQITILAVAVLWLATSCSKHKRPAAHDKLPRPVLVEPNLEVAKVRKGMTRDEVESALGRPPQTNQTTSFYKGKGMWVSFDTNDTVFNVKCVHAFRGVTKEGIGIGSTPKDLIAAFGNPDEVKHYDDGDDFWFASISINFWVQRGKVTSFIVHF